MYRDQAADPHVATGALAERDRLVTARDRRAGARDRAAALRNRAESALAERRAAETLQSMSDAFFTLDSNWRFTYLNPQTEAVLNRRRDDLLGKSMWKEFPEGVGSKFDDGCRRALREQVPVRLEDAYESLGRVIEARVFPVADGLAVCFSDVTAERQHQERRLRQAQRLEAIGRATAGVAHDFANLLAVIRGFAQLGERSSVDEKTGRYFSEIDSAGQKAGALTHRLSAFAREQEPAPTVIDLNDVVEGLSSLLQQLLPDGIDLSFVLSPQPVPVFADRSQLEQVLVNLVINGSDAIDTFGTITVSTTAADPVRVAHDTRTVPSGWLEVADSGCGIAPDVMPYIFEPFFSTKPPEDGAGLGLATVYGIVSRSGGEILINSSPGLGTTVTVALPANEPAASPAAQAA